MSFAPSSTLHREGRWFTLFSAGNDPETDYPHNGSTMKSLVHRLSLVAFGLGVAGTLHAADVTLKNAWMRPAAAGTERAQAYVDIVSDSALELTAASTTAAKEVEIVTTTMRSETIEEKVVKSLPVAAATTTRLAYNGNHLRLNGITRDIGNGDPIPVTLTFRDPTGKSLTVTTQIIVRGLLRPQQMPAAAAKAAAAAPPPAGQDDATSPRNSAPNTMSAPK